MYDQKGFLAAKPTTVPVKGDLSACADSPQATDECSNPQSPVSAAIDLIRKYECHKATGLSQPLRLTPCQYRNLWIRVEEHPQLIGFVDNKLRVEYNPLTEVLCLRMPTSMHDSFTRRVSKETQVQLDRIASGNNEAARFAAQITSVGSGRIWLPVLDSDNNIPTAGPSYIRREPDDQFQHDDARYPGVVFEIAYAQDSRKLDKAAWTYILHSNGKIKVVVGFDLGYGKNKEARLSLWQARYLQEGSDNLRVLDVEKVIDNDPFRSSDRSAINTTKSLHLPLDCFATSEIATFQTEGLPGITILYTTLAQFLDKAEKTGRMKERAFWEESGGNMSSKDTLKRKRPSTPTEERARD